MCESRKCRKVHAKPACSCFGPDGKTAQAKGEILLKLDEFEALRLADAKGLYQEDAARKMGVSRQTFGNIINSARQKIADALVSGKSVQITGGTVKLTNGGCGCGNHAGQSGKRCCSDTQKINLSAAKKKSTANKTK
ncbi:MAG: hypothetical protein A2270_00750 [Elusimicrobia bacterium RIFOXYA12_FULL_51_18]|nr:MAG: hypothetical protein A2270_00750 [Elusimicrobia bacterium RIFOXYA12_FULL_51_18]OGS29026.1 MAG: hypothetical protein A2218_08765 [Elusimicrobia bacterium RIFOXYA2_FULL_53_38]